MHFPVDINFDPHGLITGAHSLMGRGTQGNFSFVLLDTEARYYPTHCRSRIVTQCKEWTGTDFVAHIIIWQRGCLECIKLSLLEQKEQLEWDPFPVSLYASCWLVVLLHFRHRADVFPWDSWPHPWGLHRLLGWYRHLPALWLWQVGTVSVGATAEGTRSPFANIPFSAVH